MFGQKSVRKDASAQTLKCFYLKWKHCIRFEYSQIADVCEKVNLLGWRQF